jgi:hypothetical protein
VGRKEEEMDYTINNKAELAYNKRLCKDIPCLRDMLLIFNLVEYDAVAIDWEYALQAMEN